MSKLTKTIKKVLSGKSDNNIKFADLCYLLEKLEFRKRVKGDHFIFTRDNIDEIINIQPVGDLSKAYQVKQIRNIILRYKLGYLNE